MRFGDDDDDEETTRLLSDVVITTSPDIGMRNGVNNFEGNSKYDSNYSPRFSSNSIAQNATLTGAIINLTNCILGGGILALPYCFNKLGIIFGIILLFIVGCLANYAYVLLHKCCVVTGKNSYNAVACAAFGPKFSQATDIIQSFYSFGVLVAYLIVIADTIKPIFTEFVEYEGFWVSRNVLLSLITIVIIIPLCCLPSLDSLKYTSVAAIVCVFYITFLVIGKYVENENVGDSNDEQPTDPVQFKISVDFFLVLPIILFAYNCAPQFIPIYAELPKPTSDKTAFTLIRSTLLICFVLYILVASCGYAQFTNLVKDNIILNYSDSDVEVAFGRVSLAVVITLSYPLIFQPTLSSLRDVTHAFILSRKTGLSIGLSTVQAPIPSFIERLVWTICIVLLSLFISILIPNLSVALGIYIFML